MNRILIDFYYKVRNLNVSLNNHRKYLYIYIVKLTHIQFINTLDNDEQKMYENSHKLN